MDNRTKKDEEEERPFVESRLNVRRHCCGIFRRCSSCRCCWSFRGCWRRTVFVVVYMVFYVVLCPFHLFCFGTTVVFDTFCLVKEGASMVNCSQEVLFKKPQTFVISFCLTNIINGITVITILYLKPDGITFCGFKKAVKRLARKGSVWSLNITFIFVVVEYILATCQCQESFYIAFTLSYVLFIFTRLIVAYFINYLLPVKYPANEGERNWTNMYMFIAYWVTLVMFFLDTCHMMLAVSLDAIEKVTLVGNVTLGSHNFAQVGYLLLFGINVAFEARLFFFYWNKLFHGDKDLFSSFSILTPIEAENENV